MGITVEWLSISGWKTWQSFRNDRGQAPWIKVYRRLFQDPNWVVLTDEQKGHLISIWLLAADRNGTVPANSCTLRKLCHLDNEPDIKALMNMGFIDVVDKLASDGCHIGTLEVEVEVEVENKNTCIKSSDLTRASPANNSHKCRFNEFWQHWPVKRNKQKALAAWKNKRLDAYVDTLITDVQNRIKHDKQWIDGFIPHCSTYLNGHRWEDEYETKDRKAENRTRR